MRRRLITGVLAAAALLLPFAPALTSATQASAAAGACAVHVSHNTGGDTVYEVSGCAGKSIRAHVFNSATGQSRRGIWVKTNGATSTALLASNHGGYDIENTGATGGGSFVETY